MALKKPLELSQEEMLTLKLLREEVHAKAFSEVYCGVYGRLNDDIREAQRLLPVLDKILKTATDNLKSRIVDAVFTPL